MQVNSGMHIMNGQPQQSYPPQAGQPYPPGAQFITQPPRPPGPVQHFGQQLSSTGFPPASGSGYRDHALQFAAHVTTFHIPQIGLLTDSLSSRGHRTLSLWL